MESLNELNLNIEYKVGDHLFTFLKGPHFDELEESLDMMNLVHITDELYSKNIENISQLLKCSQETWDSLVITSRDRKTLYEELKKFKSTLMSNYQDFRLIMKVSLQGKKYHFLEFGLGGIKVGYDELCNYQLPKTKEINRKLEFEVKYTAGQYHIIPRGGESQKKSEIVS